MYFEAYHSTVLLKHLSSALRCLQLHWFVCLLPVLASQGQTSCICWFNRVHFISSQVVSVKDKLSYSVTMCTHIHSYTILIISIVSFFITVAHYVIYFVSFSDKWVVSVSTKPARMSHHRHQYYYNCTCTRWKTSSKHALFLHLMFWIIILQ